MKRNLRETFLTSSFHFSEPEFEYIEWEVLQNQMKTGQNHNIHTFNEMSMKWGCFKVQSIHPKFVFSVKYQQIAKLVCLPFSSSS